MTVPQYPIIEIADPKMRLFKCWGSVFVKDMQGQAIPIDQIKKVMPIMMDRGGIYKDSHSNRDAGKILGYEFMQKNISGTMVDGVLLTCKNFDQLPSDDITWEAIKSGKIRGMSIAGKIGYQTPGVTGNGETADLLKNIEGWEYSICTDMMNPEADMAAINYMAKGLTDPIAPESDKVNKGGITMVDEPVKVDAVLPVEPEEVKKQETVSLEMFNSLMAEVASLKEIVAKLVGTPAPVEPTPEPEAAKSAGKPITEADMKKMIDQRLTDLSTQGGHRLGLTKQEDKFQIVDETGKKIEIDSGLTAGEKGLLMLIDHKAN